MLDELEAVAAAGLVKDDWRLGTEWAEPEVETTWAEAGDIWWVAER